jgi:hypothetical protein
MFSHFQMLIFEVFSECMLLSNEIFVRWYKQWRTKQAKQVKAKLPIFEQ